MIRTVVADDEEPARRGILNRIAVLADFEVVGECANGRETTELVARVRPDLLFLDIQMPVRTGFEVIESIGVRECPLIVFVTAYDAFALRAFDVHALDYLLKPIDDERFAESISRVRAALAQRRTRDFHARLAALLEDAADAGRGATSSPDPTRASDRLIIRTGGRIVFVAIDEIDWIAAAGDYVTVHAGSRTWLTRETMADVQRQLAPRGFVRIHRATLVNGARVAELRHLDSGDYRVLLRDGRELKLSRSYQASVGELLRLGVD